MPRKPACSSDEIYEALKEFSFIDDDGLLLPWANKVWTDAVNAMKGMMAKDHIYLYLSQDRGRVFSKIHGVSAMDSAKNKSDLNLSGDCSKNDLNWSMGETKCTLPALRKSVLLEKTEWETLKSQVVEYARREYEVLIIGWTDALYDIIWNYLQLPCPFSFKNAKFNRNPGEIFLSIKGHCSECESQIHIYCLEEAIDSAPTLHVSTFDSRGVAHGKKRQVRGNRRACIGKQLQGQSTYAWRRDAANKQMIFGGVVPASIPSEDVLRKTKQEARDKELGLFKVKSALASVWDMKYSEEFRGSIYEIALDKFYLMYWTATQVYMYRKYLQENDEGSISIDASGSMMKQIPTPDGSKRVVFLYQALCGYRGKILPLFQMISEKHDTNTLAYWMREWLRNGGSIPKQVVTDYSLALLNATSLAFNMCDLNTYIKNCIVFDKTSSTLHCKRPRCLIRIDIAHLIKLVTRWSCFDRESPDKKDFFVRCVGLMSMCTDIQDFVEISTDVLSIALSTHEDIDDPKSHCFSANRRIVTRLKSYELPIEKPDGNDLNIMSCTDDCDNEVTLESNSAIDLVIKKIEAGSTVNSRQGRLNPYHCAGFGSSLLRLVKQFVLWTDVMLNSDQQTSDERVATSARSEEYFREIKHLIFKKGKAIRIDKFLVIHLRSLEGTNKLLNAPQIEKKKKDLVIDHTPSASIDETVMKTQNSAYDCGFAEASSVVDCRDIPSSDNLSTKKSPKSATTDWKPSEDRVGDTTGESVVSESYLNEIDDWRGQISKNDPVKPKASGTVKKRGKYLTPCPDMEIIHKRPKFSRTIPLLINGNCLRPVKIGKQTVKVRNTCAFDSTVQSVLAAVHDFSPYLQYLQSRSSNISEYINTLSLTGVSAKLYEERGCILSKTKKITEGILDCTINIGYLQENFILRDIASLEKLIKCMDCQFENLKSMPILHLNPDPMYINGMAGLHEALNQTSKSRSTSTCVRCKSTNIVKSTSAGNHLVLNIEDVGNALLADYKGFSNCRHQFTLGEIPDKLLYCEYEYKLVSAIVYLNSHYFAFIKRVTGKWEEHNDLKQRVIGVTARTLLQQQSIHILFYVRVAKVLE